MSDRTFNEEYEEFISNLLSSSWLWDDWDQAIPELYFSGGARYPTSTYQMELAAALLKKREFGVIKYGEKSFQGSKENAMSVDMIAHAKDELVDYINYTLHKIYQATINADMNEVVYCKKRFQLAVKLLYMTR